MRNNENFNLFIAMLTCPTDVYTIGVFSVINVDPFMNAG